MKMKIKKKKTSNGLLEINDQFIKITCSPSKSRERIPFKTPSIGLTDLGIWSTLDRIQLRQRMVPFYGST